MGEAGTEYICLACTKRLRMDVVYESRAICPRCTGLCRPVEYVDSSDPGVAVTTREHWEAARQSGFDGKRAGEGA